MTNEERRRAGGEAMVKSRRDIGSTMEKSRRAGGDAMIERRTGESVVRDINALTAPPRRSKTLPTISPVGSLPAKVGTGTYKAPAAASGGGIASPLVEGASGDGPSLAREYYAGVTLTSSDGLISLDVEPLKKLTMRDANGSPVVMEFAQP